MPKTVRDPAVVAFGPVFLGVDGRKLRRASFNGFFNPFEARIEGGMWIEIDSTGMGRLFKIAWTTDGGRIVDTRLWFYRSGETWPMSREPGWSHSHFPLPFSAPPAPPPPPPQGGIGRGPIHHMHNMPAFSSTPTEAASFVDPDPSGAAGIAIPLAGVLEFESTPRVFSSGGLTEGPITRANGVTRDLHYYKRFQFAFPADQFAKIAVVNRGFEVH